MHYDSIIEVREMVKNDTEFVAKIHYNSLPNDFLPSLGVDFLKTIYYEYSLNNPYGKVFVALHNNDIIGFVNTGINPSKYFKYIISKKYIKILFYATSLMIRNPKRFLESLVLTKENILTHKNVGEILFIAILPKYRGAGISKKLLEQSNEFLISKGINICGTKTQTQNISAIKFYNKEGYRINKKFMYLNTEYVWIEWDINCEKDI